MYKEPMPLECMCSLSTFIHETFGSRFCDRLPKSWRHGGSTIVGVSEIVLSVLNDSDASPGRIHDKLLEAPV